MGIIDHNRFVCYFQNLYIYDNTITRACQQYFLQFARRQIRYILRRIYLAAHAVRISITHSCPSASSAPPPSSLREEHRAGMPEHCAQHPPQCDLSVLPSRSAQSQQSQQPLPFTLLYITAANGDRKRRAKRDKQSYFPTAHFVSPPSFLTLRRGSFILPLLNNAISSQRQRRRRAK